MTTSNDRVLIVGAGPVGLCLALKLTHAGIKSTIIEQLSDANFLDQVPHRNAREALRTGIGHKGFAQLILRFGPTINHTLHLQSPRTSTATFDW